MESIPSDEKVFFDVLHKARQDCYMARDAFYTCFEKEIKKTPVEIASVGLLYPTDCKKTRAEYVKQCRTTWVKQFDRQYCAKKKGQRHLEDNECRRGPITIPYTCKSCSP
ncbi:hypothetical protein AQUCO_140000002v1 [Aquilegia coerulea]|uniref:Uncharacterized protein n=1 Tax=Aquilegia coerulea TaxID=218851 RepID=A0A2G5C064_AQUCA|nr:hypothetical protein AQUCO_140000002v1 [Aquilegia coerulea]